MAAPKRVERMSEMYVNDLNAENTVVIACRMVQKEIEHVMAAQQLDYPVVWIDKGLHEFPEQLKAALAREMALYNDKKYVILAYGMCGFAVLDLPVTQSTLVIPKFDDCIRMLMCHEKGELIATCPNRMYITKEWADSERFILKDLDSYIENYGEEIGREMAEMMLGNYSGLDVIDDGVYDASALQAEIAVQAAKHQMDCGCVKGTLRVYEKLLTGQWDEEFVVKLPGEKVLMADFDERTRCI